MTIQSVERASDIISLLSSSQRSLGITEISSALGLNKGTAWGLVDTLEKRGFLQQDPATRKYSIGPKLYEMGMVYANSLEINNKASRPVNRLASSTRLNGRVGIWEGRAVLITFLALPKADDAFSRQIGPRVPAYCSGVGKALLAFLEPVELEAYLRDEPLVRHTSTTIVSADKLRKDLERTRSRGYSMNREEMIPGVAALGAPVFGRDRRLEGSISISGSPKAVLGAETEKLAGELLSAASEITQEMGFYFRTGGYQHRRP